MSKHNSVNTVFLILLITTLSVDAWVHIPVMVYVALAIIYLLINGIGAAVLAVQYFVPVQFKGRQEQQAIAITFDDGPIEGKTEKILDILTRYGVPAAFFCIGRQVVKNPDLTKRIYDEGHLLGNHSYTHAATFDLQSWNKIAKELTDTDESIFHVVGKKPIFFRPPYGVTNPMVAKAVKRNDYTVVGWSVRSFDTVIRDPDKLLKRVTKSLKSGDIVLFHDYSDSMIQILPAFLDHVKKLGLKVVRVDKLLNEKAYV